MLPTTIDEVIERLKEIYSESYQKRSRMGYFTALYLRVTKAVKAKIEEGDYFENNERMEHLDVVFANRYIKAYDLYQSGEPCTNCWQLAFNATKLWSPLVIQHLLVGMNAHIGLDLGIAAATVSPGDQINSLHKDFNKINELLGSLVNTVENELAQIWKPLKWIDKVMGGTDEALARFAMDIARDAAWKEALEYAYITQIDEQEKFIKYRDQKVTTFGGKLIYIKSLLLRLPLLVIRLMEFGNVRKKMEILNKGNKNLFLFIER